MATYQRKLVEVEAIQWTGDNLEAVQAVAPDAFFGCPDSAYDYLHPVMSLWTKGAYGQRCEVGDWVLRLGRDVSRVKPDEFEATYEAHSASTSRDRDQRLRERARETIQYELEGAARDGLTPNDDWAELVHARDVLALLRERDELLTSTRTALPSPASSLSCSYTEAELGTLLLIEALEAIDSAEAQRFENSTGVPQAHEDTSLVQRIARAALVGVRGEGKEGQTDE